MPTFGLRANGCLTDFDAVAGVAGCGDGPPSEEKLFLKPKNRNGYRFPQAFRRTLHESWSANGLRLAAQQGLRLRR